MGIMGITYEKKTLISVVHHHVSNYPALKTLGSEFLERGWKNRHTPDR